MVRKRNRHTTRLRGYDYSQAGVYFVTVCVRNRECLFGKIIDGKMNLNQYGKIARDEWLYATNVRSNIELDEFIVMPNHFHGIIHIRVVGATRRVTPALQTNGIILPGPKSGSIGAIIGQFKSLVTKRINELRNTISIPIWQRNYYDHIIRDQRSLNRARQYIRNNPAVWEDDVNYIKL